MKYIAPFVHLVHGVDSLKLLAEVNKQAAKNAKAVDCLLQVHIATEETKFGLDESELEQVIDQLKNEPGKFAHTNVRGLMGMASFSDNQTAVKNEFRQLKNYYDQYADAIPGKPWNTLSIGMSADFRLAIEEGSTMVRIGSLLFGERHYQQ